MLMLSLAKAVHSKFIPDPRPTETKLKEEYLTCEVCKHTYDFGKYAPHQLPCGDTACLDCLRQFG